MPLRSCASAQDQSKTYSPYEWDFTKRGMAPTIVPARRNTRIWGSHPVRALAHPVSISADRNSWRMNGCSPVRSFHSAGSMPASELTIRTLSTGNSTGAPRRDTMLACRGGQNEEDRSHRETVQAGRGARSYLGSGGHWPDGHRSEGIRPTERSHRALSRRRVRGRFPAQGKNRGGGAQRPGRGRDRRNREIGAHRQDRRRQDLRHIGRARGTHPHRRDQRSGGLARVLEQDQHRAGAALRRRCLAEGEHLVALRQPFAQFALEDRLAVVRAESLAVNDPHAADAPRHAASQKARDAERRLDAIHAVKIQAVFDHPMAAAQLAQHLARQALAQEGQLLARIDRVVQRDRAGEGFGEGRTLVALALAWQRRRRVRPQHDAARFGERGYAGNRLAELLVVRRRAHREISPRRERPCNRSPRWSRPGDKRDPAHLRQRTLPERWLRWQNLPARRG